MTKRINLIAVCLMVISNSLFSQEWAGSNTTTGSISRDGNVGVGVANPQAKLDVADNGAASFRVGITGNRSNSNTQLLSTLSVIAPDNFTNSVNGAVAWDFFNNGSNPSWSGTLMEYFGTGMSGSLYGVPVSNLGALIFQNVSNGVIASNGANVFISPNNNVSACFLTNGNVGIGTTNPGSFKLAVEGKIGAREIQVTLANPFPDYVFDSAYQLRSLPDLASYIMENKHLPGIPSAAEIKKEGGIKLGEMNAKLLEKIEELTLYVIELKNENERIKEKLDKLSDKK